MNKDAFNIKFVYQDGSILTITDKSFKAAIKTVLNKEIIKETPIKVMFPSTNKTLYFDKELFASYIADDIEQPELIECTECQGLFRNISKLLTNTHEEIEEKSLWKKSHNKLILVDADEYITSDYVEKLFVEV
jgi:acetylglutamate kinase